MRKIPITKLGAERLREELKRLKTVERRKIIDAISTAREHGDLKENAEYHAARERQSFIEGRIKDIEFHLSESDIIDILKLKHHNTIVFGATVMLREIDTETEYLYQIVGEIEADIKQDKISVTSPLARAMIGKSQGDDIFVETPNGKKTYQVIAFNYA
ncbi:MAG: transcription elongation factor GreA [Chromatiales bacterium]|nr:transcription elongation factor GreA [Chromatiales bacterium]